MEQSVGRSRSFLRGGRGRGRGRGRQPRRDGGRHGEEGRDGVASLAAPHPPSPGGAPAPAPLPPSEGGSSSRGRGRARHRGSHERGGRREGQGTYALPSSLRPDAPTFLPGGRSEDHARIITSPPVSSDAVESTLEAIQQLGLGGSSVLQSKAAKPRPSSKAAARQGAAGLAQHNKPRKGQAEGDCSLMEAQTCIVCCEDIEARAIGRCGHDSVCATCSLRMRLCYKQQRCPLCKDNLKEVVITRASCDSPAAFFQEAMASKQKRLWHRKQWAPNVFVDTASDCQGGGRRGGKPPLHVRLMQQTARACLLCDRSGHRPFPSDKALLHHVDTSHDQRLCHVCLKARRRFPLELEGYTPEALAEHMASHPPCRFCSTSFVDRDDLYTHMKLSHFTCHVCEGQGIFHEYFASASQLMAHLHSEHHACEEPDCAACLVAYATREGLHRHNLEVHSGRMPRWDASRARPMQLDLGSYLPPPRDRGSRPSRRAGGPQEADPPGERDGFVHGEGDLTVLDDDLPPPPAASRAESAGRPAPAEGAGPLLPRGVWGTRSSSAAHLSEVNEFPSLSDAIAASQRPGSQAAPPRPPPLVRRTLKCACGRRVRHFAAVEGEELPPLECDSTCSAAAAAEQRSQQLASAFGVDDPQRHVAYFDRNRTPTYSSDLLKAAQASPKLIAEIEAAFAAFLADSQPNQRKILRPMSCSQRAIVHSLAEQYGLTSQSYGTDPNRSVAVFSSTSSSIPNRLLTEVAAGKTIHDITQLREAEEQAFELELVELEDEDYLRGMLREWAGQYEIVVRHSRGHGRLVISFQSLQHLQKATGLLAGGVRGKFRVDPKSSAAALKQGAPFSNADGQLSTSPPALQQQQQPPAAQQRKAASASSAGHQHGGVSGNRLPAGWHTVGSAEAMSAASPRPVFADPWFDGEAAAERASQDGSDGLAEDWEDAAALISDEAAGATPGELLGRSTAPLHQQNIFDLLQAGDS